MSLIIGIHAAHYNPAVSVVNNGRPVFFLEEERITREKHAFGQFPLNSLRKAVQELGIRSDSCKSLNIAWDMNAYENGTVLQHYEKINENFDLDNFSIEWQKYNLNRYKKNRVHEYISQNVRKSTGWNRIPNIKSFEHHYVHASMAARHSGFKDAIVLTLDGAGEVECSVVWAYQNGKLKKLKSIEIPHSLGWWYSAITEFLGFKANSGEYKVMGLAAYGKYNFSLSSKLDRTINQFSDGTYSINPEYISFGARSYSNNFTDQFVSLIGRDPRNPGDSLNQWHADLAFAAQSLLEQVVTSLVSFAHKKTGLIKIAISGGVGHNVKLAGSILQLPFIDDIFAHPLSGDLGTALGAAMCDNQSANTVIAPSKLDHVYLGTEYSTQKIQEALNSFDLEYSQPKNLPLEIAKLLARGKIFGWYQGRLEAGPRALGHRSILADPRTRRMSDRVNLLKGREIWRPLAPVVLDEFADSYFARCSSDSFMSVARKATELAISKMPGVVHVDGTLRPQVLYKKTNSFLHEVIENFHDITGVAALMNTSFNVGTSPIVENPTDAIGCFIQCELDYLAIGDFLVKRKTNEN